MVRLRTKTSRGFRRTPKNRALPKELTNWKGEVPAQATGANSTLAGKKGSSGLRVTGGDAIPADSRPDTVWIWPPKTGRAAQARPPSFPNFFSEWLCRLHVLGLPALGTLDHIELDLLAFLQAAESIRLDRREVNENVLAILAADETISFCVVKPLYCSCFHGVAYVPLFCDVA